MKKLFVLLLLTASSLLAADKFVKQGGAGALSGADWNNALAMLPSSVSCGDRYFVAGGSGGTYSLGATSLTWKAVCTSANPVQVFHAVDCSVVPTAPYCSGLNSVNPASIAGWQATYGTTSTIFDGTVGAMVTVCGPNYLFDGVIPATGTPAADPTVQTFGIEWKHPKQGNFLQFGAIGSGCQGTSGVTQFNIASISGDGATATVTISATKTLPTAYCSSFPCTLNNVGIQAVTPSGFVAAPVTTTWSDNQHFTYSNTTVSVAVTSGAITLPMGTQTLRHMKFNNIAIDFGYNILSCSRTSNVNTYVLDGLPGSANNPWVAGTTKIDVWGTSNPGAGSTPMLGIGGTDFSIRGHTTASALVLQTLAANSPSAGQTTITLNQTDVNDTCNVATNPGFAVIDTSYGEPLLFSNVSQTYETLNITDNYFFMCAVQVGPYNTINLDFERNYRDGSWNTYSQHGNGLVIKELNNWSGTYQTPVISNNIWKNIEGTQVFGFLGSPTVSNLQANNNVVFQSDDANPVYTPLSPQAGVSRLMGDNTVGGACVTGYSFANNTIYNNPSPLTFISGCTSGGTIQNNLWVCPGCAAIDSNFGTSSTENHNTIIGTGGATSKFADATDYKPAVAASPFTSIGNFSLVSDTFDRSLSPACTSGSNQCINQRPVVTGVTTDIAGVFRGTVSTNATGGAYQFVAAGTQTLTVSCLAGSGNGTIKEPANGSNISAVCTAGVLSGTTSHAYTAGTVVTLTEAVTSGAFGGWSGACAGNSSTCTLTMNSPLLATASFQTAVTCTLTLAANSLNAPSTVSATTALTGVSGAGSFWFVLDPLNASISVCSYPYSGCAAAGQSGNLPYTVSGLYSLGACSNGVCCTGSTAPLNINTGAGSAAH